MSCECGYVFSCSCVYLCMLAACMLDCLCLLLACVLIICVDYLCCLCVVNVWMFGSLCMWMTMSHMDGYRSCPRVLAAVHISA